ncbi:hypothetical protein QF042_002874 [Pedobacter sp. W3I1]|uniref:DUF5977 domain-containing protein n=1 Tax=Pedobacter sp. W3I1 TaxID=3042291 RepID=UPI00278291E5|nr:DUF5977 domain-containing protein [Pedobacter sp. W3I1]MDQ0639309.1 hypothetical protein [Pedobacter sp. W3I1]
MKLKYKLSLILFLFVTISFGQIQKQFPLSMPTANAASLGNFLETPVSKFTGVPSINIPLYEISEGNLSIPVSLSYHAGGVRPDAHASWVGLGWSLKSGGVISRVIRGKMDELDSDVGGFYDNHTQSLGGADWSSTARLQEKATQFITDPSPDEFSFSVGNLSGTFLMDDQGNWKVRCNQDVKVVFNNSDFMLPFIPNYLPNPYGRTQYFRTFGKFTLIAGDGTKYVFGGTTDAIDYSLDFFGQNASDWMATSWYLTQVISADDNHTINLTYERDQFTNVIYSNKFQNYYIISTESGDGCDTYPDTSRTKFQIGGNLLAPVYLKSVETSKELLEFNRSTSIELRHSADTYSTSYASYQRIQLDANAPLQQNIMTMIERQNTSDTTLYKFLPYLRQNGLTKYPGTLINLQWKKLDQVSLKDKSTNQFIKRFNFNYTSDTTRRLTLLSLKESNPSATAADTIPPYRFYYDETYKLPGYLTGLDDDWGYYKGSITSSNYASPRLADPDKVIAETLRKIIFPTGGYKLFYFESNNFTAEMVDRAHGRPNVQKNGGGLRIKAIHDYDPVSKTIKSTRYFYVKNFVSPTQINMVSSGYSKSMPVHDFNFAPHSLITGETFRARLKSRNSVIPQSENSEGSPIGYSEVAEVFQDNSFIVSKYTNFDDGHLDEGTVNSLYPDKDITNGYTSLSLERGKLKYEATYNSAGTKLKSTAITYQPMRNDRTYVRMSDARRYQICYYYEYGRGLGGPYLYEGGAYKFYTYPYVPVSKVDSVFDGANPVITTTNMFYDNPQNKLLTRTEQIRTDGKTITGVTLYPQDYSSGTPFIDQMITKNLTSFPIEAVSYLTDPGTGSIKILSGKIITYNAANPFLKDTDFSLETASPILLSSFKFSGSVAGNLPYNTSKALFNKHEAYKSSNSYVYDSFANLSQVNTANGISSAVLWGYNHTLPIAQVANAKSTEIYYDGFEEQTTDVSTDTKVGLKSRVLNGAPLSLPSLAILSDGRKYKVSFWYKNTSGNWTFLSATYTTLPATLSGYTLIDELRIYPEGALMNTMGYISSRGQVRSVVDEAGREKSYQYDALNRLRLVKDQDKNILNHYNYNFSPATAAAQVFYFNTLKSGVYQKNDCNDGKTGAYTTYSVAAGSYASNISQADADALAQNEVNAKGQANANLAGKCYYYNVAKTGTFNRTNCGAASLPTPMIVNVAAGTYTSEISQADADAQAQAKVDFEGSLVNVSGLCYVPVVTFYVTNAQNTTSSIKVAMKNLSTNVIYNTTVTTQGQSSATVTIPKGTYSITLTNTGVVGSTLMKRNGSNYECHLGGTWSNITLGTFGHENLQFVMSSGSCPPLD